MGDWRVDIPFELTRLSKSLLEDRGWFVSQKADLVYDSEVGLNAMSLATTDPLERLATAVEYENMDSGIFASVLNFFDQGAILIILKKEKRLKSPAGAAIYFNGAWHTKKPEDRVVYTNIKLEKVAGKTTVTELSILFIGESKSFSRDNQVFNIKRKLNF